MGIISPTRNETLSELELRKNSLTDVIEAEKVKLAIAFDDVSIKHYFEMYRNADFNDEETRNDILEHFIDKIYVYDDKLVIDLYTSDDKTEVDLDKFEKCKK